jgi:hypothetical protein
MDAENPVTPDLDDSSSLPAAPKPRADAKLKTLPEERQDEIVEYAADHSLAETLQWLDAAGLETSNSALGRFLSWHRFMQQLARSQCVIYVLLTDRV